MKTSTVWTASSALLFGAVGLIPAGAQVAIKRSPSGYNVLTVQQEFDVGRQSAAVIERQVGVVTSARTTQFLNGIGALLAAQAPGTKYPFRVTALNTADVNLLALPDGQIYVTRGLLSLTRSEGEVAGLLAHAMAHVVLRHGSAQASRAYLARAGLSALGGVAGAGAADRVILATGGYGPDAAFLRFDRTDEYEADALGAELMSKAGYDPVASAAILATLRRDRARIARIESFDASHPPATDRERRIRNLANVLNHGRSEIVGGFSGMRWRMPATTAPLPPRVNVSAGTVELRTTPAAPTVPAPSTQFTRFRSADLPIEIDHPANWDTYQSGLAMSFVPTGGVLNQEDGAPTLLQGAVVNYYEPFESAVDRWNNSLQRNFTPFEDRARPRPPLEDATDDLVRQILKTNAWLSIPWWSVRPEQIDGLRGYSVRLRGRSPVTGEQERVTVYTMALPDDHVIYMACVAGGRSASSVEKACARMVQSLRVNDSSLHRSLQR